MKTKMDKEWMIKHLTKDMIHYNAMFERFCNFAKYEENVKLRAEYFRMALKYGELGNDAKLAILNLKVA